MKKKMSLVVGTAVVFGLTATVLGLIVAETVSRSLEHHVDPLSEDEQDPEQD